MVRNAAVRITATPISARKARARAGVKLEIINKGRMRIEERNVGIVQRTGFVSHTTAQPVKREKLTFRMFIF